MQDNAQLYAAISAYGSWAAVGCALLIVWLQSRSAKRLTGLQLFIQVSAQYDSGDMQLIRARIAGLLLADSKTLQLDDSLLVHYENVAILLRRGLLDRELVWNIYSHDVPRYWHAVRHYAEISRQKASDPTLYEEFENLAKSFQYVNRSPLGTRIAHRELTPDDISEFLTNEHLKGKEH
jgi:hypothetical protein